MKKDELAALPKDELINIIKNLENKYSLRDDNEDLLRIDFHALLESASDIIFVLDVHGLVKYINWTFTLLYPSKKNYAPGKHYSHYLPDIEKKRAEQVFSLVIDHGEVLENELMRTFDEAGNIFYFTSNFSPIKDSNGDTVGLVGIMRNITETHNAEKKVKQYAELMEERVREMVRQAEELKNLRGLNADIISNAPIGIFLLDIAGMMLSENPALKEIMGHGAETRVGVNLLDYSGFVESGLGGYFNKCITEKRKVHCRNVPYVPISQDRELIINVTMTPLFGNKGNVEKVLVMVEDNTVNAQMTRRINKSERLSALGSLASGVALEIMDHANRMVMDLNFIDKNVQGNEPAAGYVETLNDELVCIKRISEQLLNLATTGEKEKIDCDVNRIIKEHPIPVLVKRITAAGLNVKISLPEKSPLVKATPGQIRQIVRQLLENAEDAIPDWGDVEIRVESIENEDGHFCAITISDSGIGIAEENISKIFQPFFTTKGKKVTGLGLMIVNNIVDNLQGSIGVKSQPGLGSTFRVVLPAIED